MNGKIEEMVCSPSCGGVSASGSAVTKWASRSLIATGTFGLLTTGLCVIGMLRVDSWVGLGIVLPVGSVLAVAELCLSRAVRREKLVRLTMGVVAYEVFAQTLALVAVLFWAKLDIHVLVMIAHEILLVVTGVLLIRVRYGVVKHVPAVPAQRDVE